VAFAALLAVVFAALGAADLVILAAAALTFAAAGLACVVLTSAVLAAGAFAAAGFATLAEAAFGGAVRADAAFGAAGAAGFAASAGSAGAVALFAALVFGALVFAALVLAVLVLATLAVATLALAVLVLAVLVFAALVLGALALAAALGAAVFFAAEAFAAGSAAFTSAVFDFAVAFAAVFATAPAAAGAASASTALVADVFAAGFAAVLAAAGAFTSTAVSGAFLLVFGEADFAAGFTAGAAFSAAAGFFTGFVAMLWLHPFKDDESQGAPFNYVKPLSTESSKELRMRPLMTAFHEISFPRAVALGASGGPERLTDVVTTASGREERNTRRADSRRRWDAGYGVKTLAVLAEVVAFFEERRGRLHGFRWHDRLDHSSAPPGSGTGPLDQMLATGDGLSRDFALVKAYGALHAPYPRPIAKPVAGSVRVAVNGIEQLEGTHFSLDATRGLLHFADAPPIGAEVSAGFLFDVPVRFDTDFLEVNLSAFAAGEIPRIPVIEIRP